MPAARCGKKVGLKNPVCGRRRKNIKDVRHWGQGVADSLADGYKHHSTHSNAKRLHTFEDKLEGLDRSYAESGPTVATKRRARTVRKTGTSKAYAAQQMAGAHGVAKARQARLVHIAPNASHVPFKYRVKGRKTPAQIALELGGYRG